MQGCRELQTGGLPRCRGQTRTAYWESGGAQAAESRGFELPGGMADADEAGQEAHRADSYLSCYLIPPSYYLPAAISYAQVTKLVAGSFGVRPELVHIVQG